MMKYYSKRFISVLLMVCMLLAGFPTQAFAMESANYTLRYTANDDSTVAKELRRQAMGAALSLSL